MSTRRPSRRLQRKLAGQSGVVGRGVREIDQLIRDYIHSSPTVSQNRLIVNNIAKRHKLTNDEAREILIQRGVYVSSKIDAWRAYSREKENDLINSFLSRKSRGLGVIENISETSVARGVQFDVAEDFFVSRGMIYSSEDARQAALDATSKRQKDQRSAALLVILVIGLPLLLLAIWMILSYSGFVGLTPAQEYCARLGVTCKPDGSIL